jgi:hypothetical protein
MVALRSAVLDSITLQTPWTHRAVLVFSCTSYAESSAAAWLPSAQIHAYLTLAGLLERQRRRVPHLIRSLRVPALARVRIDLRFGGHQLGAADGARPVAAHVLQVLGRLLGRSRVVHQRPVVQPRRQLHPAACRLAKTRRL